MEPKIVKTTFGSKLGLINIYSEIKTELIMSSLTYSTLSDLVPEFLVRNSDLVKRIFNRVKIEEYWEN